MDVKLIEIARIKPASYNPRKITDEQFEQLKSSISEIGFCMPIIVNAADGTIIAGHQRTKAASAIGIKSVPCLYVNGVVKGDEIKFNQMHNAAEAHANVTVKRDLCIGFSTVGANEFVVADSKAPFVKEICKLIMKYGNALCAVVCGRDVLVGHHYVRACQLLGIDVNASVVDSKHGDTAKKYFTAEYGHYSYEKLSRNTYVQGLAQLYRNPKESKGKKRQASTLYEKMAMPYIKSNGVKSVLDFGCGKGDYIGMIARGMDAVGVEFFNNNGKSIDVSKGNRMIDALIAHLKSRGLFDVVVCDSVLNSVDCIDAERAVMLCVNAFSKGKAFVSGRPIDSATNKYNLKTDRYVAKRFLEFFDCENFSANYRNGNWYYQKWHSKEQFEDIVHKCGFKIESLSWLKHGDSFQAELTKTRDLTDEELEFAIGYEFNLPLPAGRRYGRHSEVMQAYFEAVCRG